MRKLVVFTGAGISAESGIKTFRDSDGLWEEYNIMDVATPEAWTKSPELVLEFYNKRKAQVKGAMPNLAHNLVAELEDNFEVRVITQNIDDLHERAGSTDVLHLHGIVTQARSSVDENLIYDVGFNAINLGDKCELGFQLRPHIVWFGEDVPNMNRAYELVSDADILIIIGTSLNVHPAAGLINDAPTKSKKYLIDPNEIRVPDTDNLIMIKEKATTGMQQLVKLLN
ncbi:MAG: NAD-dependent deacylase [Flavobacteriales bacterium]|nr:NAD-dependent deacylase [Flavobacteriales bacterium]MBT6747117.1 NAD-dependent deacylase [Flavobacteriales bacterium]